MKRTALLFLLALWSLLAFAGDIDQKQTIAQLATEHSMTDESLWDFLSKLPTSKDAQIFYAILFGNVLGAFGNYFYRWQAADGDDGLWQYFAAQGKKKAWFVIGSIIIYSGVEVESGLFVTAGGIFIGWSLVIISGVKTGFMGASFGTKKKEGAIDLTAAGQQPKP